MRLPRTSRMFAVVVLLCMPCAAADTEQLLSRNATYRLYGMGHCYTGQVMPGVNMRAPKDTFLYTPLVEQTDTGDLLIDGDRTGKTMVYTPWSWSAHWKLIVVEMKLPGPSKVSRVDVYLPESVAYQPQSVTVFVRTGSGAWAKIASIFSETGPQDARVHERKLTFPLDSVACQDLKIVCSDGDASSRGQRDRSLGPGSDRASDQRVQPDGPRHAAASRSDPQPAACGDVCSADAAVSRRQRSADQGR